MGEVGGWVRVEGGGALARGVHSSVTLCCFSEASLNCVDCYWCEALIAEGNVAAACQIMEAAVGRCRAAAAAADADTHVTLACALAVAGATLCHY